MLTKRRHFLKQILTLSSYTAGLIFSKVSLGTWLASDFSKQAIDATLAQQFGEQILLTTSKIKLKLPRVAENGSVVPITITSSIDNVDTVYIFAEKNPVPFIAKFSLDPELETFIGARFKMKETCDVIVIVHADGQYYQIKQSVKVTLGGCGG
ncbi:MAG: sulfur-oxidizing protein SoxY [Methyloprofundus sp.]|nr:MAG: sulfur-oxidizing protein SoxY [Methyloprofundus sp.]